MGEDPNPHRLRVTLAGGIKKCTRRSDNVFELPEVVEGIDNEDRYSDEWQCVLGKEATPFFLLSAVGFNAVLIDTARHGVHRKRVLVHLHNIVIALDQSKDELIVTIRYIR